MVPMSSGVRLVNRFAPPFRQLATAGAVALALLVAACGLKGPLDPPPSATPAQAQIEGEPQQPPPEARNSNMVQPARKRVFLDWLLD
jgi:predicted small lipoprotein YifL